MRNNALVGETLTPSFLGERGLLWLAFTIPQEFEKCHVLAGVKALADATETTSCGMQGSREEREEEWGKASQARSERGL